MSFLPHHLIVGIVLGTLFGARTLLLVSVLVLFETIIMVSVADFWALAAVPLLQAGYLCGLGLRVLAARYSRTRREQRVW